jgi:hypothetical protein
MTINTLTHRYQQHVSHRDYVEESELVEKVGMTVVQARILKGNKVANRSSEVSVPSKVCEEMDWNSFFPTDFIY